MNAYPLSWPNGWPRAKTRSRFGHGRSMYSISTTAARRLTISDGLNRVLAELERMGIRRDDVIVSTNVRTRMDGLPRSGEPEPKDPGAAVYWRGRGRDQVMAIDQYDRVADNLAAIAGTLEAMRAIERWGGAQILERAFTGFVALPSTAGDDDPRSWWEVLGAARIPRAAVALLKIVTGGELPAAAGTQWQGFRFVRGALYTPDGIEISAGDVRALAYQRINGALYCLGSGACRARRAEVIELRRRPRLRVVGGRASRRSAM